MTGSSHEHWLLRAFDRLAPLHTLLAWIMTAALLVAAVLHFAFGVGNYPNAGARTMVGFLFLIFAAVTAGMAFSAPRLRGPVRARLARMIGETAPR
jgi:hypothetical protein